MSKTFIVIELIIAVSATIFILFFLFSSDDDGEKNTPTKPPRKVVASTADQEELGADHSPITLPFKMDEDHPVIGKQPDPEQVRNECQAAQKDILSNGGKASDQSWKIMSKFVKDEYLHCFFVCKGIETWLDEWKNCRKYTPREETFDADIVIIELLGIPMQAYFREQMNKDEFIKLLKIRQSPFERNSVKIFDAIEKKDSQACQDPFPMDKYSKLFCDIIVADGNAPATPNETSDRLAMGLYWIARAATEKNLKFIDNIEDTILKVAANAMLKSDQSCDAMIRNHLEVACAKTQ